MAEQEAVGPATAPQTKGADRLQQRTLDREGRQRSKWGLPQAQTGHQPWTGQAPGPERRVMPALVNGLLWFAMFAIPMMIAVMLRRLGRKYGLGEGGDPAQEPDYRRWA
jgi:hypothetical protein